MPDFGIFRGFNEKLFGDKLYAGQLPTQLGLIGSEDFALIGLLDTYTGAAAAYSLRRLSGSYNGSAIRVRRASDNTEQDIGFSDNVLDTSSLTSFCSGTNGFVKTWYDQSGNGYNATQATAASQPQIVSSGSVLTENGQPAIKFINANQTYLRNSDSWTYQTAFTLVRFILRPSFAYIINSASNISKAITDINGQGYRLYNAQSLYFSINPSLTTQDLVYGLFNGVISEGSVDNSTITTGNAGTLTGTGLTIGISQNINSSAAFDGTMQEIILYNSDQSSNRTGIQTNINSFYSIY